jgi:hypothetical protein
MRSYTDWGHIPPFNQPQFNGVGTFFTNFGIFIPSGFIKVTPPEATIEEKLEAARLRVHEWIDFRFELEKCRQYIDLGYSESIIELETFKNK